MLQDLSKTVVTKTVVTTITTQTQETKTVVTKEKPAEESEPGRLDNEPNGRQSMLPLAEGSTPMSEVLTQLRRTAPREEVETIRFPSSPSAYIGKDSQIEDNLSDQNQSEQAPHSSDLRVQEVKDQEEAHHEPQPAAISLIQKPDASPEVKQDRVPDILEKANLKKAGDAASRWQSFLGISEGSDLGFQMLPAACRLLFFLIGVVVVFLVACGFASAALLG